VRLEPGAWLDREQGSGDGRLISQALGHRGPSPATPTVQVNVSGCVPFLFPMLPNALGTSCPNGQRGFAVNRTVVFHDEGV